MIHTIFSTSFLSLVAKYKEYTTFMEEIPMPGITIDRLDIGIYVQYARRMQLLEQVQAQFHIKEATSVPAQALIVDLYPKLSELDLLLGVGTTLAPWAFFFPPKNYAKQRRSPFAFHRVMPIFGSTDAEKDEEALLEDVVCDSVEEEEERSTLKRCIAKIKELNELLRFIGGRVGQFLQG